VHKATRYALPLYATAQLQPIHTLHLACGAQYTLLPVAVGAMNIHNVCNRQRDVRRVSSLNILISPGAGA